MSSDVLAADEPTVLPDERSAPRQPYPGLRPFHEDEQRIFFGRDHQIKEILRRLQQTYFAVVIGGSGSGKSSIVRAGVIPALRKKHLRARGDFWLAACFSPTDRPLQNLAAALAEFIEPKPGQANEETIEEIEQTLLETNSLAGFLDRYRSRLELDEGQAPESRAEANLLIFCDQFEEIFRPQNRNNPETRQLVDLIVEAHRNREQYPQLYVIIGMRSEDLHRCAAYIDLPNVINEASFLTRRLDQEEIASAIIEPVRLVLRLRGIRPTRFEPVEVDPWPFDVEVLRRLYKAVSSLERNPDHLPLLQHLLSVLWRHVEKKPLLKSGKVDEAAAAAFRITADDLAAALGFPTIGEADKHARDKGLADSWILERALDQAAEGVMPQGRRARLIAELMFRLLAELDDRGNYSRRWTKRTVIADVTNAQIRARDGARELVRKLWHQLRGIPVTRTDKPVSNDEIEGVIRAFTSVYPFLHVEQGREGKIDVAHESFIRNWRTFREWLQNEHSLAEAFRVLRENYETGRRYIGREARRRISGWWKNRKNNVAWALEYRSDVGSTEDDTRRRALLKDTECLLARLRGFYRRSVWLNRGGWALGAVFGIAVIAIWLRLFLAEERLDRLEFQNAARGLAESALGFVERARPDRSFREDLYEAAVSMHILETIRGSQTGGMFAWLGNWTGTRYDPGAEFFQASELSDRAARKVLALEEALQQHAALRSAPRQPAAFDQLQKCRSHLQATLGRLTRNGDRLEIENVRHIPAPLEPPNGGKRLVMIRLETNLYFMSLDDQCSDKFLFQMNVPQGTLVDSSPDLRLIVATEPARDGASPYTWLWRMDWIRKCENDAGDACSITFSPAIEKFEVFYRPVEQHRTWTPHKPLLLEAPDLERAKRAFATRSPQVESAPARIFANEPAGRGGGKVICDRWGDYVAFITDEGGDSLRVAYSANRSCQDYAKEQNILLKYDLNNYSIRNLAFAEPSSSSNVPGTIYLQGPEENVVYGFAWNPADITSGLCSILREKFDDRAVPSVSKMVSLHRESSSARLKEMAGERGPYAPKQLCHK